MNYFILFNGVELAQSENFSLKPQIADSYIYMDQIRSGENHFKSFLTQNGVKITQNDNSLLLLVAKTKKSKTYTTPENYSTTDILYGSQLGIEDYSYSLYKTVNGTKIWKQIMYGIEGTSQRFIITDELDDGLVQVNYYDTVMNCELHNLSKLSGDILTTMLNPKQNEVFSTTTNTGKTVFGWDILFKAVSFNYMYLVRNLSRLYRQDEEMFINRFKEVVY